MWGLLGFVLTLVDPTFSSWYLVSICVLVFTSEIVMSLSGFHRLKIHKVGLMSAGSVPRPVSPRIDLSGRLELSEETKHLVNQRGILKDPQPLLTIPETGYGTRTVSRREGGQLITGPRELVYPRPSDDWGRDGIPIPLIGRLRLSLILLACVGVCLYLGSLLGSGFFTLLWSMIDHHESRDFKNTLKMERVEPWPTFEDMDIPLPGNPNLPRFRNPPPPPPTNNPGT